MAPRSAIRRAGDDTKAWRAVQRDSESLTVRTTHAPAFARDRALPAAKTRQRTSTDAHRFRLLRTIDAIGCRTATHDPETHSQQRPRLSSILRNPVCFAHALAPPRAMMTLARRGHARRTEHDGPSHHPLRYPFQEMSTRQKSYRAFFR